MAKTKDTSPKFELAVDAQVIAKESFTGQGQPHEHLKDAKMLWLLTKASTNVTVVKGIWKHLLHEIMRNNKHSYDVIVQINRTEWNIASNKEFLVDMVLCQINYDTVRNVYERVEPGMVVNLGALKRHGYGASPQLTMLGQTIKAIKEEPLPNVTTSKTDEPSFEKNSNAEPVKATISA